MAFPNDNKTINGNGPAPARSEGKRTAGRGGRAAGRRRSKPEEGNYLYALAIDEVSSDGNLKLHKLATAEKDILRAAYKGGEHYFRLQKFVAKEVDSPNGGMQIVGVPAEQ